MPLPTRSGRSPLTAKQQKHSWTPDKTVFFSTHVLEVAEKLCDRVGIINKGKLVFVGTIAELKKKFKEEASLEKLFLEITEKED